MRVDDRRSVTVTPALLCAAVLLLVATTLVAQDAKQASGRFDGREWYFEASGAYAFPGEIGMDDEQGILVAISNSSFAAKNIDQMWDRQHVINEFHVDEETLVVYFHFAKDGKYRGMNYYFGSGDGCGFCYDGSVKSTVKVANGRIAGKVSLPEKPDEQFWDVTFDVPIAPTSYGTALPADGGEIGKIYAAYHKALDAASPDPLRPLLDDGDQKLLSENAAEMIDSLREDHPTKSYKIVKGFVNGDKALLLIEGENSYMNVKTEVHFVKLAGTWRVYDELLQVRMGG
jgi:opacity protein-like surface antigen